MKVKICPSCGHEIYDRGKFCPFCGCELKGGKTVDRPEERIVPEGNGSAGEAGVPEGGAWNPEKAYGGSAGRVAALIIAAVLLCAAAVVILSNTSRPDMKTPRLHAGMTFPEACGVMRNEGYREEDAPYLGSFYKLQRYGSREVFGLQTEYSELEVQEGSYVAVGHMYYEEESGTIMRPGPVFRQLEKNLNSSLGEGTRAEDGTFYFWQDKDKLLLMTYNAPDEVQIVIYYTTREIDL